MFGGRKFDGIPSAEATDFGMFTFRFRSDRWSDLVVVDDRIRMVCHLVCPSLRYTSYCVVVMTH